MFKLTSYKPTEADICKQFVKLVDQLQNYQQFNQDFILLHIPNESKRSITYGKHLKSLGLLPGAADYMVLYSGGWAAIEFKRDSKSKQSDTQKAFQTRCNNLNMPYLLTYSTQEAIEFIHNLFK